MKMTTCTQLARTRGTAASSGVYVGAGVAVFAVFISDWHARGRKRGADPGGPPAA